MDTSGLIIAFPASFFIFLLALPVASLGLRRLPPILQSLFLALRPWRLLLTLYSPWLLPLFLGRASLLPLILHCRASLLRRGLVRLLRAWASRTARLGRRWTLDLLLPWASHPRLFLPSPLSRCGRSLSSLLLKMLADCLVTRLVTVMLAAERPLLLHLAWIPVSRILPLVDGQRGGRRSRAAIPPVPSTSPLLPLMAPVLTPAGRRIRPPPAKVHWRLPVVAHGDTEDEQRHNLRLHNPPGAVVP